LAETNPIDLDKLPKEVIKRLPRLPPIRKVEDIPRYLEQSGLLLDDLNVRMEHLKSLMGQMLQSLEKLAVLSAIPVSKQWTLRDIRITTLKTVELSGPATLDQLFLVTDSTDYAINCIWDTTQMFVFTWAQLQAISTEWAQISAYAKYDFEGKPTGDYVLSLSNISIAEKLTLLIKPKTPFTLKTMVVKYTLRGKATELIDALRFE